MVCGPLTWSSLLEPAQVSTPADLVGQRILVLEAVSLIANQEVARPLSLELVCVQAKGLIGDNQHLQRAANERACT